MVLVGNPLKGKELEQLKAFLATHQLRYDEGIEYTVCILNEWYEIIGTGSVEQNVIKCLAINPNYQGEGLSATILSLLVQYQFEQERMHLFVYTKPSNSELFKGLSFYPIARTKDVLLMENYRYGFRNYLNQLVKETPEEAMLPNKQIGAIVANCNPFTRGHRYLIEEAAKACDYVHVFVVSDKRALISVEARYTMVKEGIKDLSNVILHEASDYMISAATFPTYFIKDQVKAKEANCQLDILIFSKCIAPTLNITRRYVGREPNCLVTSMYNQSLNKMLPKYGIELKEIERNKVGGDYISASLVRRLLELQAYDEIEKLVPDTTLEYLKRI